MRNKGILAAGILVPTLSLSAICGTGFALIIGNNLHPQLPTNDTEVRLNLSQIDNKKIKLDLLKPYTDDGTNDVEDTEDSHTFKLKYKDFEDIPLFDSRANTAPIIKFTMEEDITGFDHFIDMNEGFRTRLVATATLPGSVGASQLDDHWYKSTNGKTAKELIFSNYFENLGKHSKQEFLNNVTGVTYETIHDAVAGTAGSKQDIPVTALMVKKIDSAAISGNAYDEYLAFLPLDMYVTLEFNSPIIEFTRPVLANDEVSIAEPLQDEEMAALNADTSKTDPIYTDSDKHIDYLTADGKNKSETNPYVFRKERASVSATDTQKTKFTAKVSLGKGLPDSDCAGSENRWRQQYSGKPFTANQLKSLTTDSFITLQKQYLNGTGTFADNSWGQLHNETKPVGNETDSTHQEKFNQHMFSHLSTSNGEKTTFQSFISPIDLRLRDEEKDGSAYKLTDSDWGRLRQVFYKDSSNQPVGSPKPNDTIIDNVAVSIQVKKVELEYKLVEWRASPDSSGATDGNCEFNTTSSEFVPATIAFLDSYESADIKSYEVYPRSGDTPAIE